MSTFNNHIATFTADLPNNKTASNNISQNDLKTMNMLPNINGLNTNLTSSKQWFAYFPIENILGRKYNGIELHLKGFSLPQMIMGSMQVSYKGYQKEIPNKVMNAENKELTLTYFIDEYWQNYKALYLWMSSTGGNINNVVQGEAINPIVPSDYLPLRIYLLDNYKKKIIQFLFENCWIKVFNEVSLDQNNPNEVEASFTCSYDRFCIEDV